MSGKTLYLENAFLKLLFQGVTDALFASAAGSLTTLYISLHTSDPDPADGTISGEQTANETAYPSYARQAITRNGSSWTVSSSTPIQVAPAATVSFPASTAGTQGGAITHVGIGTALSGSGGKLLYSGALTPNITMAVGVIPQILATSTITET